MLDFNMTEMLVVAVVALLVIGPKDLPKAMRFVGQWVAKARGVARQFRTGFDSMVREAELAEMEKKWSEENARIMREHPPALTSRDRKSAAYESEPDTPAPESDDADRPAVSVEKPVVHPDPEPQAAANDAPDADGKAPS